MTPLENARHEAFARAIVEGKAAGPAYVAAGYSKKGADQSASALLRNPKVADRIAVLKGAAADETVMTAREVLQRLTVLARSNMRDYVGDDDITLAIQSLTVNQGAAIQEHTVEHYTEGHGDDVRQVKKVKLKLADKLGPLVALGRHYKLFTDKHEHTGKDGKPIEHVVFTDRDRAKALAAFVAKTRARG